MLIRAGPVLAQCTHITPEWTSSFAADRVAGSCGAAFTRVGVEPLELIGIDGTQHPRREYALKQAADPARTVPGAGDLHERGRALRGDREGGDRAGAGIGLGQDPARFGLGDLRPVLAGAPARRQLVPQDRTGAHATGLDPEVRERRGQEPWMVLAHVRDIAVDRIGWCL